MVQVSALPMVMWRSVSTNLSPMRGPETKSSSKGAHGKGLSATAQ